MIVLPLSDCYGPPAGIHTLGGYLDPTTGRVSVRWRHGGDSVAVHGQGRHGGASPAASQLPLGPPPWFIHSIMAAIIPTQATA